MRKQNKLKTSVITNLTYCRLKADLAAVEMELAGNAPLSQTTETGFLKKVWDIAKRTVKNELRKKTAEELKKDKAAAEAELSRFECVHTPKEYALSSSPAALKKQIGKLFKRDKYGLEKLHFAFSLLLDDRYAYQRPEPSLQILSDLLFDEPLYMPELYDALCENFKYLHNGALPTLDELISLAPNLGNVSLQSLINRHKQRRFKAKLRELTGDQLGALLAIKLTVAEKSKALLPQAEWENLADETLKFIDDLRADAEYSWVFGHTDEGVAEETFSLCRLCVARLAEIVAE